MLSIASLLNAADHMSPRNARDARPTLPGLREMFPDISRSRMISDAESLELPPIQRSPGILPQDRAPAPAYERLEPAPRGQHTRHTSTSVASTPSPNLGHSRSPSVRPHAAQPTSTPAPALYQVLAFGPNGLNTLQAETERPIGIYRQDKRRHEIMMATGSSGDAEGRRYVCQDCGAAFVRPSELRAHQHRHDGRKQFSCDHCGKDFSTSSNLTRHKRAQHQHGDTGNRMLQFSSTSSSSPSESPSP